MRYDWIGRQSPVPYARLCLCVFLALLLWTGAGLATACFGAGTGFSDVGAWQWHAAAVERARAEGILEGYPDGTFRPDRTVSCGEFLRMAVPEAPKTSAAHWAGRYYQEGLRRQLFTEGDIRESALDRPLARKYMALVYSRLLEETDPGLTGIQIARTEDGTVPLAPFTDVDERSSYEYPIALAAAAGLLKGYPDGTFRPDGFLTRAEAATAFVRLLDLWDGSAAAGGPPSGESEPDLSNIDRFILPKYQEYLDKIIKSLIVSGSNGKYNYSFDIPDNINDTQVFFRIAFYNKQGGNLAGTSKFTSKDSTPRKITNDITGLNSLDLLGSASFNFSIATKDTDNWHDYLLKWRTDGQIDLRMQVLDNLTNQVYQKYLSKDLHDIFSWR